MSMAVLGTGPLARALAASEPGPVALLGADVLPGRWLSRRVNAETGEGIRAALHGVERLVICLDGPAELHGLALVLRPDETQRSIVLVTPPGVPVPVGVAGWTGWAQLELGWGWGPGNPVHDAWFGRPTLQAADPGPIPIVPLSEAVPLVHAALRTPGARWRWRGEPTTLPALAERLAPGRVGRPWRARAWAEVHGVEWELLKSWAGRPGGPRETT